VNTTTLAEIPENKKQKKMRELIDMFNNLRSAILSNNYFKCKRAFIRGSFATGLQTEDSDLDLLIVSDDFYGIDVIKRKEIVKIALSDLNAVIDPICLTDSEYNEIQIAEYEISINTQMIGVIP